MCLEKSPGTAAVSVVIPAYNRERVIARAIASAQGQRPRPPAEIIVVDDHSTDGTAQAAGRAGAMVVRHGENRGPGGARNTAVQRAGQPWVAFLDSDDAWLPDHLAKAMAASERHVLVAAPGLVLASSGRPARLIGNGHGFCVPLLSPLALLDPENLVATSGTLVRTETIRRAGGFPLGNRSEDLDLWLRLLEYGSGVALAEPGYIYSPEEMHASSDTAGMHAAVLDYLGAYRNRSWYDPAVTRRLTAQGRWDAARADQSAGRRHAVLRHLAWAVAHPASIPAIVRLLAYRRTARRTGHRSLAHLSPELLSGLLRIAGTGLAP